MPTRERTSRQWARRILRRVEQALTQTTWNGEDPAPLQLAALIIEFAAQGVADPELAAARIVFPRTPWPPLPTPAPLTTLAVPPPRPPQIIAVDGRTGWQWT